MAQIIPDPYLLKAVETGTKTIIELLHEDIKVGINSLYQNIKASSQDMALKNVDDFKNKLEEEYHYRVSIPSTENPNILLSGNLNDPDFAYLFSQAIIASARTNNQDKHQILARAVTERLFAKPESLVALSSSIAVQIVPNLTPNQLDYLGFMCLIHETRPDFDSPGIQLNFQESQEKYISWLELSLNMYKPYPKMRLIDFRHLEGMSCIAKFSISVIPWENLLRPKFLFSFEWPQDYFSKNQIIQELKQVDGINNCRLTTIGSIIGIYVLDLRFKPTRTNIMWDKNE